MINQFMTDTLIPNPESPIQLKKKRSIDIQTSTKRKSINLNASEIGNQGLQYLLTKSISHVIELKLWKNSITSCGILLINDPIWKNLKSIYLNSNNIGNTGCKHLSKGNWESLQNLSLYNNQIDNIGCFHLSKGNWKSLRQLGLDHNNITSFNELNHLRAINLKRLLIDLNPIREQGYLTLLKSQLAQINELNLINNFFRSKNHFVKNVIAEKYDYLTSISF